MSEIDKAILWMTDGKRNDKFRDKFVGDIDIDVSNVLSYLHTKVG
jgi:ATP-dependent Lon protease